MGFGAKAPWERTSGGVRKVDVAAVQQQVTTVKAKFPVDTVDLKDNAVTNVKAAAGVVDGDTITGSVIQTSVPAVGVTTIRMDGPSNLLKFYSGLTGETAGAIDPAAFLGRPGINVATGTTATAAAPASLALAAGTNATASAIMSAGGSQVSVLGSSGVSIIGDTSIAGVGSGAGFDSSQDFITGGNMAVTSTHTDIPGITRSITSPGVGAVWMVTFTGWLLCGTTAYTTLVELNVSGTGGGVQTGNAIMSGNTTGATCSQVWRVTGLAAGAHTFKCVAFTNAVGQTGTVSGTHSNMVIERRA